MERKAPPSKRKAKAPASGKRSASAVKAARPKANGGENVKAGAPKRSTKPKKRRSNLAKADTALGGPQEKRGLKPQAKAKGDKSLGGEASSGHRGKRTNVKTARYRKHSSTLWLDRQLNDPYVARAKTEGFRSRAAFKLIELDEKYALLKSGARIVDLGCAPGGWCQVAARAGASKLVGIDYLAMPAVEGADILELDFLDPDAPDRLRAALGGEADLVLSDMAAPTTGHRATDHLRVVALAEAALDFAEDVLAPGGGFVCKVFQGGAEGDLLARLRGRFTSVKHAKPKASRPESPEKYVVATGFKRDAETPSSADGDDPTVSN